ncbi:hypothetical protein GE09DRAFT_418724 [Coniochaeta sp. 2T2.1]|nr:hypothetical protein GE09DRAFT_418724 [Coniochaeta sp. 2T2.1]
MPKSLQVLNLFEDYNRMFPFNKTAAAGSRYRPLHFDHLLAQAIHEGSKNLRELTACFIFDAAEFFHRFLPLRMNCHPIILEIERSWDRLEVLTLTADCFSDVDHKFHCHENGDGDDEVVTLRISQLLLAAGRAASLMPKLKLMEIWDSTSNIARIFRYEVKDEENAAITWISNLDKPVDPLGRIQPSWLNGSLQLEASVSRLRTALGS